MTEQPEPQASTARAAEDRRTDVQEPTRKPHRFVGLLSSIGPGLIVALAWLGTGDLIDSSVAGSTFGYALIWALLIAVLCRYAIVSGMARYQLCNAVGDRTILDGYHRVWKWFPTLIGVSTVALGFVYNSFLLLACGTALHHLTTDFVDLGAYSIPLWATATMAGSILLSTRRREYLWLERVAKVTMAGLVVCFGIALFNTGIDFLGLIRGIAFELPEGGNGVITAVVTSVSLIGAVGGSAANLLYPYFMRDRGWTGPEHRRIQTRDLLTGVGILFALALAVWIVAAETMFGSSAGIATPEDLANMMQLAVGPAGPYILWIALFFVAFDNIPAQADVFSRVFVESLHKSSPRRLEVARRRARNADLTATDAYKHDPLFRVLQLGVLTVLPILFSFPWAPNVVVLSVLGSAFSVITVPILMFGLIWITSSGKLMLPGYRNKWFHYLVYVAIACVGVYSTYRLIVSLIETFVGA